MNKRNNGSNQRHIITWFFENGTRSGKADTRFIVTPQLSILENEFLQYNPESNPFLHSFYLRKCKKSWKKT